MPRTRRSADVLREHSALRARVATLDAHLAGPLTSTRRAPWMRRLASDLDKLAGRLRLHFRREEKAGLFDDIEAALPECAHACARLRSEHSTLLERLAAVQAELTAPRPTVRSLQTLRRSVRALLADLAHHEETENALLLDAVEGEEIGALD